MLGAVKKPDRVSDSGRHHAQLTDRDGRGLYRAPGPHPPLHRPHHHHADYHPGRVSPV